VINNPGFMIAQNRQKGEICPERIPRDFMCILCGPSYISEAGLFSIQWEASKGFNRAVMGKAVLTKERMKSGKLGVRSSKL
jgi:hypothetical protein